MSCSSGIPVPGTIKLGNFDVRFRVDQLCRTRLALERSSLLWLMRSGLLKDRVSPMSVIYPLHLQRKIDRRWFQRAEQATSARVRRRAMIDVLRETAVLHHDDEKPRR